MLRGSLEATSRNAIGSRIRELRRARGLTLFDVAHEVGVSESRLSQVNAA